MPRFLRTLAHRLMLVRLALSTLFGLTAATFCDVLALHLLDLAAGLRHSRRIDPGGHLEDDLDGLDELVDYVPDDGRGLRTLIVHSNPDSGVADRAVVFLPKPRSESDTIAAAKALHPAGKGRTRTLEPLP